MMLLDTYTMLCRAETARTCVGVYDRGRYTVRLGTQSNVIFWDTPWGVPANETFLPQNLKEQGYHTAMFGKWHVSSAH